MWREQIGRGALLTTILPGARRVVSCDPSRVAATLTLALLVAAAPRIAAAEGALFAAPVASVIDFALGFQGRLEPTFAREAVSRLFSAGHAAALFAPPEPNEPVFARPEAHSLFASRAEALSGDTAEPTPAPVEPVFARPEVAALFGDATPFAAEPDLSPADAAEGPVFTRPEVAALFAEAAGWPSPEPAPEAERWPVFARPEIVTLFEGRAGSLAGEAPETEPETLDPVFARPEVAALFDGRTAVLGEPLEPETKPAEPVFAQAEVTGLFLARTEELAAEFPDAPSPRATRAVAQRAPAAVGDGPSMTGSLASEAARPDQGSRLTAPGLTTASLGQPKRVGGGRAVWYEHPGRTASGEIFNPDGMTAGHRTLPLGTRVRVVNLHNGRSVVVRINDRGPVQKKFEIDLSRGSARVLGFTGVAPVEIYAVE